ncbi:hypothetical protein ACP275_13G136000 [Erythranthe tilingii]
MDSRSQTTPTQRLKNLEKRTTRLAELAYEVMEEMANPSGPTNDLLNSHFSDFKQLAQDTQMALHEEIKSIYEYRPFEKCRYLPRISNEIPWEKLEFIAARLGEIKHQIGKMLCEIESVLLKFNPVENGIVGEES